jgi:hypothetical protein
MSTLNPERGSFSGAATRMLPEFYPSLHVHVGMGSEQGGRGNEGRVRGNEGRVRGNEGRVRENEGRVRENEVSFIHHEDLDLESIGLHTPRSMTPTILDAPRVTNRVYSGHSSSCLSKNVVIGNIKFPLSIFIILSITTTAFSIASIFVHDRYSDLSCIGTYSGIIFGYVKWLYIYAWTNIGIIGCMMWLYIISRFSSMRVDFLKINTLRAGYLFQLSWYIVGSILYFIEVRDPCSSGGVLYEFGLALFFYQSFVWITIVFQDRTT